MRAIAVDDSTLARFRVKAALLHAGFSEVLEAAEGYQALEILSDEPQVDLVLVDWIMPGMQGPELIRAIRSDHTYDDIPILLVSTESNPGEVEKALALGANGYIRKPFSNRDLLSGLKSIGLCSAKHSETERLPEPPAGIAEKQGSHVEPIY